MKIKVWLAVCSMLMILGSSSCVPIFSFDIEVALKKANKWDVNATLVAIGGANDQGVALIAQSLSDQQNQLAANGISMVWKQLSTDNDGNTPFQVRVKDADPEVLNKTFFTEGTFTVKQVDGQRQVVFYMLPTTGLLVRQYSVTLIGKQVISSNGQQISNGTVRWDNPTGVMEAVLLEGTTGLSFGVILLFVGVVLVGGAFWYFQRSKSSPNIPVYPPSPRPVQVIQPVSQSCFKCGYQLPTNAQFCPKCGVRQ